MERALGLVTNDKAFVPALIERHRPMFNITSGIHRGGWGLGFHRHGEILVKKRPILATLDNASQMATAAARHAVAHAASRQPGPWSLNRVQPYRYRNWLWALVGADGLGADFLSNATEQLRGFTADGRWMDTPAEAVMMLFMEALHAEGELDRRGGHTRGVTRALAVASRQLAELAGGQEIVRCAALLHIKDHTFALSLGRAIHLVPFEGLERCEGRRRRVLRGDTAHVRAVALTTEPVAGAEVLPAWSAVEVGTSGHWAHVSLN